MLGGLNSNSPTFLITDCINYFRLELGLELACLDFLWKKNHTGFPFNFVFSSRRWKKRPWHLDQELFWGNFEKEHLHIIYSFLIQFCTVSWVIVTNDCLPKSIFPSFESRRGKEWRKTTTSRNITSRRERRQKCRRSWKCDATDVPFGPKGVQIGLADTRGTSIVVLLSIPQR